MAIRLSSSTTARLRNGRFALARVELSTGGGGPLSGLSDFTDLRVFQRIGTSRQLNVNLTYLDAPPKNVEARILDFSTDNVVVNWTALTGLTATNGFASGKINVPQGGWYRLEVRSPSEPNNVLRGSLKFGVGVVIGLIGQSNMENAPSTAWYYPLGDHRAVGFKRLDNATYYRVGRINDSRPVSQNAGTYGSNFTAAEKDGESGLTPKSQHGDFYVFVPNIVAGGLNVPVCVIERAVGGSAISSWQQGQTNWTRFATAVAAAGGDLEMVIWYQGETNAKGMVAATHKAALANIHNQCMALGGRTTSNFHFGVISLGTGGYLGSVEGDFGAMRAVFVDYANNTAGAFLAGCAHDAQTGDGVHLNGQSYGRLGPRVGKTALSRLGVGLSGAGPKIVSASKTGSEVTITVQHSGGTGLQDGAGGAGTALKGFEFKDAGGNVLTYSATSFPTSNTIRMTVTGTPVTVSYAMMNNPHQSDTTTSTSSVVLASIPCDNVPFLYSTGAPLQPCPAINITS